jgi:ATP phosphoribosyltransferase
MTGLTLAIPSKGRLEEKSREFFAAAGLEIARSGRSYAGTIAGQPAVTVRFYPAAEIARELIRGNIDIGVTGADLIHEVAETGPDQVIFARPLGFGEANVVVAIPDSWIDVTHMADLADVASDFRHGHARWLRVATKYVNLTRRHFARHGIAGYRIVESAGSTEAAPASGTADLIVDITTTGQTLAANALRILEDGVILKSEANIVVSRTAVWTGERRQILADLLNVIGDISPDLTKGL